MDEKHSRRNTAVNDKYSQNSRQRGKIHNRSDASDILLPGYVRKKSAVVRSEVPRYTAYIESQQIQSGTFFIRCRKEKELSSGTLLFDDILCDTAEFLKENPTETVIVSIKMDSGVNVKDFYKSFRSRYIDSQKDLWYTENKIPTLGAVRGKIVLMRRCMLGTNDLSSVDNGLDFSYWEDQKGTDNPLPLPCWFGNEKNEKAIIQDRYALKKEEKWQSAVTTMLGDYRPHKNIMALNFLSTRGNPRENAEYINKMFSEYSLPDKPFGIIIFDFLTEALAEKVINTNTEGKDESDI